MFQACALESHKIVGIGSFSVVIWPPPILIAPYDTSIKVNQHKNVAKLIPYCKSCIGVVQETIHEIRLAEKLHEHDRYSQHFVRALGQYTISYTQNQFGSNIHDQLDRVNENQPIEWVIVIIYEKLGAFSKTLNKQIIPTFPIHTVPQIMIHLLLGIQKTQMVKLCLMDMKLENILVRKKVHGETTEYIPIIIDYSVQHTTSQFRTLEEFADDFSSHADCGYIVWPPEVKLLVASYGENHNPDTLMNDLCDSFNEIYRYGVKKVHFTREFKRLVFDRYVPSVADKIMVYGLGISLLRMSGKILSELNKIQRKQFHKIVSAMMHPIHRLRYSSNEAIAAFQQCQWK